MNNELFKIYKKNFPFNIRQELTEKEILNNKNNIVLQEKNELDELIGVSIINKNTILMLCVDKAYRNKGIGSKLLEESERIVYSNGYDSINIGVGYDYLMPGVPLVDNNYNFFNKRGYTHSWGEDECFDMFMELKDMSYPHQTGEDINGIVYKFAKEEDIKQIVECVNDAESDFTQYYMNINLYKPNNDQKVLIALKDDEVVGTLIISIETEAKDTGSVGCTTTKTKYRHQGIATNLVCIGTKYLKDMGLKYGYLGYTYTGLDKLYGVAGYHITNKYMMAKKILKK